MNENNCEKCLLGLLSKELNSASCPYFKQNKEKKCVNYTNMQKKEEKKDEKQTSPIINNLDNEDKKEEKKDEKQTSPV